MFSLIQKKTILFLLEPEDQNVLTPSIQEENVQSKYHTHLETDFGNAKELMRSTQADCVVISWSKQGLETLLNFEKRLKSSELPVFILLLENPDLSISIKLIKCNIRDYLVRSTCDEFSLLQTLDSVMEQHVLADSLTNAQTFINLLPGISYKCKNDETWTMLFISQSCETITGYTPDELINNKRIAYGNLIHPDDRQMVREKTLEALSKKQSFSYTYRLIDKSGATKWLYEQGYFLQAADGLLLQGYISDVTSLKQSEERTKKLLDHVQSILNHLPECVYIIEPGSNTILFANQTTQNLIGYNPVGEKCYSAICGLDEPCSFCVDINDLNSSEENHVFEYRNQFLKKDFLVTEKIIHWINETYVRMVLSVDITDQKTTETEINVLLTDIQQRVKEKECLYNIGSLLTNEPNTLEQLNRLPEIIADGFSNLNTKFCRINYHDFTYTQPNFKETTRSIHTNLCIRKSIVGSIDIFLEENLAQNSLQEEKQFLNEIGIRISDYLEKWEIDKALQESEKRANLALKAANQGLYDWNMATGEIIFNDQFATMLEYDPKSFSYSYQKWKTDIHPDDYEPTTKTLMEYFSGRIREYRAEFRLKNKSGKWKWILSVGEVVEWDSKHNPTRFLGTHTDIDEIRRHKEVLERRVKERTIQLEEVAKELESFSYSVSHDLRAPLRHINSFSNMLVKNTYGQLDKKSKHYMDVIISASTQMSKLIDDLLDFSRNGRANISPHDIDVKALINDSISSLNEEIGIRTIKFVISSKIPQLRADPILLKQVFNNLISNAIKYTRPVKKARVKISYSENEHEHIVSISDNGVGFEMKFYNKLFGVFQRLHHNQEFEGTGIGLANVKRIIARHGGKVWAKGEPNKGATFSFSIPKHYAIS